MAQPQSAINCCLLKPDRVYRDFPLSKGECPGGLHPRRAMRLSFSAPVAWDKIKGALLRGPAGKAWKPKAEEDEDKLVWGILFPGPFPEKSSVALELPAGVQDDAGRKLSNAKNFPLKTQTDDICRWQNSPRILESSN